MERKNTGMSGIRKSCGTSKGKLVSIISILCFATKRNAENVHELPDSQTHSSAQAKQNLISPQPNNEILRTAAQHLRWNVRRSLTAPAASAASGGVSSDTTGRLRCIQAPFVETEAFATADSLVFKPHTSRPTFTTLSNNAIYW